VGSVREEISRWCHGGPKRARSWKRRTQPRKAYSLSGLLYSERRDVNYGIWPSLPIRIGKQFCLGPGRDMTRHRSEREFEKTPGMLGGSRITAGEYVATPEVGRLLLIGVNVDCRRLRDLGGTMHHGDVSTKVAAGLLALRKRIKAAKIPSSKLDESINVAVWNIREFDKQPQLHRGTNPGRTLSRSSMDETWCRACTP
jgi:hypothetical protein